MPRLLALEYNSEEARVVVATPRGTRCTIEDAFTLPLTSGDGEAQSIGEQVLAGLAARGYGRSEALLAIGRTNIELRNFSVPPAPPDELPDLVRMQALREFNSLDEDWPLDFQIIEQQPGQPISVLAAAIDPSVVKQIEQNAETAGLKPRCLTLRPCAAASLLNRAQPDRAQQLRLLVDLLATEADLTAVSGGTVKFLRTTRLPGASELSPEASQSLQGELRRTMAAVQNQLGGPAVESIVLFGSGPAYQRMAESIQAGLGKEVELFDPFAGLDLGGVLRRQLPDNASRFAPLLGMLLDECEKRAHSIDFLHPRRRPPPPDHRVRYILGGIAAVVLMGGYLGWGWMQRSALEADIRRLTVESKSWEAPLAKAEKAVKAAEEIGKWTASDVVWLDEFRELATDLPPQQQIMLTQLTASASAVRGGEIKIEGLAKSAADIDRLEEGLRDKRHRVEGKGRSLDDSQKGYSWRFVSSLLIDEEKK